MRRQLFEDPLLGRRQLERCPWPRSARRAVRCAHSCSTTASGWRCSRPCASRSAAVTQQTSRLGRWPHRQGSDAGGSIRVRAPCEECRRDARRGPTPGVMPRTRRHEHRPALCRRTRSLMCPSSLIPAAFTSSTAARTSWSSAGVACWSSASMPRWASTTAWPAGKPRVSNSATSSNDRTSSTVSAELERDGLQQKGNRSPGPPPTPASMTVRAAVAVDALRTRCSEHLNCSDGGRHVDRSIR